MSALHPESADENELARHELGGVCARVIAHVDALSLIRNTQGLIINRGPSDLSPLYPGLRKSVIAVDGIILDDGTEYSMGIVRSDDSDADQDMGTFNIDDPQAYYRMTFRRVQDTPEGRVDLEAYSVEMYRASRVHTGGESTPSELIIWDMVESGQAEYLKGEAILGSRQLVDMKAIEALLAAEEDKAFARALYE